MGPSKSPRPKNPFLDSLFFVEFACDELACDVVFAAARGDASSAPPSRCFGAGRSSTTTAVEAPLLLARESSSFAEARVGRWKARRRFLRRSVDDGSSGDDSGIVAVVRLVERHVAPAGEEESASIVSGARERGWRWRAGREREI